LLRCIFLSSGAALKADLSHYSIRIYIFAKAKYSMQDGNIFRPVYLYDLTKSASAAAIRNERIKEYSKTAT